MDSLANNIFEDIRSKAQREEGPKVSAVVRERAANGNLHSGHTVTMVFEARKEISAQIITGVVDAYERMCKETNRSLDGALEKEISQKIDEIITSESNKINGNMRQTCQQFSPGASLVQSMQAAISQAMAQLASDQKRRLTIWVEKSKRLAARPQRNPDNQTVFLIKRIVPGNSLDVDAFFQSVVNPAVQAVGLRPVPVNLTEGNENISRRATELIRSSVFVVADLTGERPNCYFEAAYAEAMGILVLYTARADHDPRREGRAPQDPKVHFDLDGRTITYWNPDNLEPARAEVTQRIQTVLSMERSRTA